jgi:hypothetical protein
MNATAALRTIFSSSCAYWFTALHLSASGTVVAIAAAVAAEAPLHTLINVAKLSSDVCRTMTSELHIYTPTLVVQAVTFLLCAQHAVFRVC